MRRPGKRACARGDRKNMFGQTLAAVVFVPGDLVVIERCRQHIHVAVAVDIDREHAADSIGRGADEVGASEFTGRDNR